jgi:hypothetical protein
VTRAYPRSYHGIYLKKTGGISENLIKTYFMAAITVRYAPEYKVGKGVRDYRTIAMKTSISHLKMR